MKCTHVVVNGVHAIVCGGRRYEESARRCACGNAATKLCDWKVKKPSLGLPRGRDCDAPLCDDCSTSPTKGKDLCPEHWTAWEAHPANKQRGLAFGDGTTSAPASVSSSTSSRR